MLRVTPQEACNPANDLVFPSTLVAVPHPDVRCLVFVSTLRTDTDPALKVAADGSTTPVSMPKPDAVWPLSSAAGAACAAVAVIQADDALHTVTVNEAGDVVVAKLVDLPADTEAVAVAGSCAVDGLPCSAVAIVDDKPKPPADTPDVFPAPPAFKSLYRWTAEVGAFAHVADVPSTSEDVSLSADGTKAVWRVFRNPIPEEAEVGEYWVYDHTTGTAQAITEGAGRTLAAVVTPDGCNVVYQANHTLERPITTHMTLWVAPVGAPAGTGAPVTIEGMEPGVEIWSFQFVHTAAPDADRQQLAVTAVQGNANTTYIVDFPRGAVGSEALDLPCVATLSDGYCTSKNVALAPPVSSAAAAADGATSVYWYGHESLTTWPCVRAGSATVAVEQPTCFDSLTVRMVKWDAPDGLALQGAVFEATDCPPDAPLLVNVHGGPAVAFLVTRSQAAACTRYPYRHLLLAGYRVFEPFFRGTMGFGDEFLQGNIGKQGIADLDDVMSGIRHLKEVEKLQFGDNLGVWGGSYGGYMTNVCISRTKAFKAAVSMYGFVHNRFMTLEGGDPSYEFEYIGDPGVWPLTDTLTKHDVFQDLGNITTPTLIQHGADDDICCPSQSFILYRALRAAGVPTELRMYKKEKHGFSKPHNRHDAMLTALTWFSRFIPVRADGGAGAAGAGAGAGAGK